jgi:hypothetical protein
VRVGDQKGDGVAFGRLCASQASTYSSTGAGGRSSPSTNLYSRSSHDNELFGAAHQELGELERENAFELVLLLDFDADADRVNGWLDVHALIRATINGNRGQQDFLSGPARRKPQPKEGYVPTHKPFAAVFVHMSVSQNDSIKLIL